MARRKASLGTGRRLSALSHISPARHRSGAARTSRRLRFEPLEARRLLAITVDTIYDIVDLNDGVTSLREAIFAANSVPGADTIDFSSVLTATAPATLLLEHGELEITDALTISGPGATLLTIDANWQSRIFNITASSGDVSINGITLTKGETSGSNIPPTPGPSLTVYNGGAIRSATSGLLTVTDSVITSSRTKGSFVRGGGIWSSGTVVISGSVVSDNQTLADQGQGGGIYAQTLFLSSSVIRNNSTAGQGGYGGGIYANVIRANDSIVESNRTTGEEGNGGGIFAQQELAGERIVVRNNSMLGNSVLGGGGIHVRAKLNLQDSVVTDNHTLEGGRGGGIDVSGTAIITRSKISNNSSSHHGGGIKIQGSLHISESELSGNQANLGGGIYSIGELTVESSTISGNSSRESIVFGSAGIYLKESTATVRHSTITNNRPVGPSFNIRGSGILVFESSLLLEHSIVAGNIGANINSDIFLAQNGTFLDASNNLIGRFSGPELSATTDGIPDANGNLVGASNTPINPQLGALADNGGFELPDGARIFTHALMPGSPAINAGNLNAVAGNDEVPEFDQRGEPFGRIVGGRIDIGSFEYQAPAPINFVVDTLTDESDGDYSAGDLSLREAIELANASNFEGVLDTISFDPQVFASPSTIWLTLGALLIIDSVEIQGLANAVITVDASGNDPTPGEDDGDGTNVFIIDDLNDETLVDVSISGLTLQGGDAVYGGAILSAENLTITGSRIFDNASQTLGGGIFSVGGTLSLAESTVSQNRAVLDGGGVASVAELVVTKSTISGNTATSGGGVYAAGATTIDRSQITGNTASDGEGQGGGILAVSGPLTVFKSRVAGNSAFDGGGIWSDASLELSESTVSGNTAARNGGGIVGRGETQIVRSNLFDNQAGGDGGGLFGREEVFVDSSTLARNTAGGSGGGAWLEANDSDIKLLQVTVSSNRAERQGAGVWVSNIDGSMTIAHSTIAYNESPDGHGGGVFALEGELDLDHTIVALNTAAAGPDITGSLAATIDARYSLVGNNQHSGLAESPFGQADANGNRVGSPFVGLIDPLLEPLLYRGGPTPTHALSSTSLLNPAIDAGNPAAVAGQNGVPAFDQRGMPFARVIGPSFGTQRIDIGAFEKSTSTAAPPMSGNYNHNSAVDAADYAIWRDNLGKTVFPSTSADGNGDGEVDWADYEIWKWNFGQLAPPRRAATSVIAPEEVGGAGQSIATDETVGTAESKEGQMSVSSAGLAVLQTDEPVERDSHQAIVTSHREVSISEADILLLLSKRRVQHAEVAAEWSANDSESESSRPAREPIDMAFAVLDGFPAPPW